MKPFRTAVAMMSLLATALIGFLPSPAHAADKPNILFIMVDDLGKSWISCYGAEDIKTPHIDKLAASGMKFNNAWCMPQCTPTRVTLLTGQYPFRHGWTNHWDVPRWGAGAHFDAKMNTTYANVLRDAGYATAAAGKWQIDDFRVEPQAMNEAGFDSWAMWTGYETGNKASANRYWDPYIHTGVANGKTESKTHKGAFGPDVYCDHLIDFIARNKASAGKGGKPLFMYFPMALTHGPMTSTPDNKDQGKRKEKNGAFPGMVQYMDKLVGRLVAAIESNGLSKNTIIIFTTDNGTGGTTSRRLGRTVRGGKAQMHEQTGTAMPFIVSGPGLVPAGVETDALIDFTDLLPTFAELGGGKLPEGRVVDGKSFAPLLLGKAKDSPRKWIMSMGGSPAKLSGGRVVPKLNYDDRVIRNKRFKLWIDTKGQPAKLFDLIADPWEEKNLINSDDADAVAAKKQLMAIAATFPAKDGAPIYKKNPPQPWDRKEGGGKKPKQRKPKQ